MENTPRRAVYRKIEPLVASACKTWHRLFAQSFSALAWGVTGACAGRIVINSGFIPGQSFVVAWGSCIASSIALVKRLEILCPPPHHRSLKAQKVRLMF